jgi:hypothetical protein
MLYNPENRNSLRFVVGLCVLAISTGLEVSTARAQDAAEDASTVTTGSAVATASAAAIVSAPATAGTTEVTTLKPVDVHPSAKPEQTAGNPAKPYFIEFRARSAYSYGHTFLVHGHVGQKITKRDVVGLHPVSESPVPWMIGHVIPVLSETGASDGDYEEVYVIARYRILLSEAEYKTILAHMRQMQRSSPIWHAVLYNCNAFVGDVAKYMGLRSPMNTMQMPKEYINELKSMNGGRQALSGGVTREAAASTPNSEQQRTAAASSGAQQTSAAPKANGSRPRAASGSARPQRAVRAPEPAAQAAPAFAAVQ